MNKNMAYDKAHQTELLKRVYDQAEKFLAERNERTAYPFFPKTEMKKITDEGLGTEAAMDMFMKDYEPYMAANSGQRFYGFVIGGVTPAALAGDWLTSLYDQNAFGEDQRLDRQIELEAAEGLRELLNLREDFIGSFTSGATMATTNALAVAREWAARGQKADPNDGVYGLEKPIILSAHAHASIYKGLSILGIGRNSIIEFGDLPGRECADLSKLEEQLKKYEGKPVIVIANMGTASSGDCDDLKGIAELKKKYGFYLHVDGAVGAMALASPKYKHIFDGVEEADSFTADCHKWFNSTYDCAISFVRKEHKNLQYQVYAQANRITREVSETEEFTCLGSEGSRRLRALPVWMALMAYGKEGFAEMVERDCECAKLLFDKLSESGVYKVHEPLLINGFAFTLNKDEVSMADIKALEYEIRKEGTTYLNVATVCGVPHLRVSLSNWGVEKEDVEAVAKALIACGKKFM